VPGCRLLRATGRSPCGLEITTMNSRNVEIKLEPVPREVVKNIETALERFETTFHVAEGEGDNFYRRTLDDALPKANIGYQMLLKMGWKENSGLGRRGQGAFAHSGSWFAAVLFGVSSVF